MIFLRHRYTPGVCISLLALLMLTVPAQAQTTTVATLGETVITATRSEKPIGDVLADVTIIDQDAIARAGVSGFADLLVRVPGIELTRNGGLGNQTNLFLRGGESRHFAVLVDGVRMDTQNTSGGANWATLPLSQIERIEIVRGPTSAVYGSDAMAGVVQIFTRRGEDGFHPSVELGMGTYNTQKLDVSATGAAESWDYAFALSGGQSDGYNIRTVTGQNPDTDGYLSNSASLHLGLKVNSDHRLELNALQSRMDAQYDKGLTKDYRVVNTNSTQSVQWSSQWSPAYSSRVSISQGIDQSAYNLEPTSNNRTLSDSALWFNEYKWGSQALSLALEQRNDSFELSDTMRIDKRKAQTGAALGYSGNFGAHSLQVSARHDVDSEFGPVTTASTGYGYALSSTWRVFASTGTAFRTPTLYQRFSKYGVSTLAPESARNWDLGLNYADGPNRFGVVLYRNQVSNLLTFQSAGTSTCPIPANGCYANTGSALFQGMTVSAQRRLASATVWGSLDLQDPRDGQTGKLLKRRSTHHATLGFLTPWNTWQLGSDLQLSALRYDDDANTTVLPGYALLNLYAERPLARDWKLLLRVDNATDAQYQTVSGYATAGRSLYLGVKWAR